MADWVIAISTAVLAVATFVLAWATLMAVGTSVVLVFLTKRMVNASYQQIRMSGQTIDQMKATEERQLRAYLTCRAEIKMVGSEPRHINFKIRNAGQTPAYCVNSVPDSKVNKHDFGRVPAVPRPIQPSETTLGPAETIEFEFPLIAEAKDKWNLIMNNDVHLFFYGTVFFVDAFKRNRTADFCFKSDVAGTVRLAATPYGNSQDDMKCLPPPA